MLLAAGVTGQNFNRPVPPGYPAYQFDSYSPLPKKHLLICPFHNFGGTFTFPQPTILDSAGYIIWYTRSENKVFSFDMKFHPLSGLLSYTGTNTMGNDGACYLFDSTMTITDSVRQPGSNHLDYHEFLELTNGNFIRTSFYDSIMDLSALIFNGQPGDTATLVKGWKLEEIDLAGNVYWDWVSFDHLSFSEWNPNFGYNPSWWNYCHGNSVFEMADGNLLLSFRSFNAGIKISRTTGQVLWRFGGNQSDFVFQNDSGFSGQHTILISPTGTMTVFDNHNSSTSPQLTRMVEYAFDTNAYTAARIWEYYWDTPYFSPAMGSFEILPDGSKLINWGNSNAPNPMVTVLDASDQKIAEMFFINGKVNYRAYLEDLPFTLPQPYVDCEAGASITLSAPAGHSQYIWSNGETTRTITVSATGTYQFYVPYGDGMIASHPFFLDDLNFPCANVSAESPTLAQEPELIGIYDLWGRKVPRPQSGRVYIYRYTDGSAVKRVQVPRTR